MDLNLNQSNVSLDDDTFRPMLTNLQANILKFHGRKFAHHLFIVFDKTKISEIRQWICDFASTLTSARQQLLDAAKHKTDPSFNGGTVRTLSLSTWGCQKLGLELPEDADQSFKNGMQESKERLQDDFSDWEKDLKDNKIDMLIIVADDHPVTAQQTSAKIIASIPSSQGFVTCVLNQRGNVLKMKDTGVGIEHFSYADGVSQPMYLKDEIDGQPSPRIWDDQTDLIRLLVKEQNQLENCFGSYFVFRKLEQKVRSFKEAEGDNRVNPKPVGKPDPGIVPRIIDASGPPENIELSGSMIIGRFENSTPVALSSQAFHPDPASVASNTVPAVTNDFDYAEDPMALKCPYHAHIRLVNPRRGDISRNPEQLLKHRITRRAIPYDDHQKPFNSALPVDERQRFADDKITKITDAMLQKDNQPEDKVGLLFMCYQHSITEQFEVLQGDFANGRDSLITQGSDIPRTIPQKYGEPLQSAPFQFSKFVKTRGGEYFYTPSIPYLKNLC